VYTNNCMEEEVKGFFLLEEVKGFLEEVRGAWRN
jgi:hypothetical protein